MRHLMITMLTIGGFVALTTTEASAVIYCAAGVYRAGCVHDLLSVPLLSPRVLLLSSGVRSLSRLSAGEFTDYRRSGVVSTGACTTSDFSYWRDLAGEYLRLAEACKDTPMALVWTELAGAYSRAISELETLEAAKTSVSAKASRELSEG